MDESNDTRCIVLPLNKDWDDYQPKIYATRYVNRRGKNEKFNESAREPSLLAGDLGGRGLRLQLVSLPQLFTFATTFSTARNRFGAPGKDNYGHLSSFLAKFNHWNLSMIFYQVLLRSIDGLIPSLLTSLDIRL